jgi:uncharacterized membrane protein
MTFLIAGIVLFIAIHLLPSVVPMRNALHNSLGDGPYKGLYSLVSLVGFGLIVWGKAYAEFIPVWSPPVWTRYIVGVVMLPALFMIVAANVPGNIKRFTPHPMMWAVFIWSAAHLGANGDQASIILFAPFAAFSLVYIVSANARGAAKQTEVLPFSKDLKIAAMGLVAYLLFGFGHAWLFKMPAF